MKLALFTTVYPGVEPFLADWRRSIEQQTDRDFTLWIGLDQLTSEAACAAMGGDPGACWIPAQPGASPAQVRERVWERMLPTCDGIVMVDSDDILAPTRIEAARQALLQHDLAACALRLVDAAGHPLGVDFGVATSVQAVSMLPRYNVFGLSNTAYRSDLLRRCLPLPESMTIVDWYLATLAWLQEARISFDPAPCMDYRQHGNNLTQVRGPFTAERVARDTEMARRHFRLLAARMGPAPISERWQVLTCVAADIERFWGQMTRQPAILDQYVDALNSLDLPCVWWCSVAHPDLGHLWRPEGP